MTEDCRRVMEIEVPADIIRERMEALATQWQRRTRIPGFRPGKAPLSLIRERYSEDILNEVVKDLVPEYVWSTASQKQWEPVGAPTISDLKFTEGEPLKFKATLEVMPEIRLQDYSSLAVTVEEAAITDEDLQHTLQHFQERAATYINLDPGPLADGEYASITVEAVSRGNESPGVHAEEVLCEIGGANTLPEFTDNLRGVSVGEQRTFDVSSPPQDSSDPRLAGKSIAYKVKVLGRKQRNLPAIDDDLARELGGFDSLQALREKLREDMQKSKQEENERAAKNKLRKQLVELHDFAAPESMVERQLERRLDRLKRQISSQGMNPDSASLDWSKVRVSQRDDAEEDVKSSMILEKISQTEKIEAGEEEIAKEIQSMAEVLQQSADVVRARLTKEDGLDRMISRIRAEKALDSIFQKAMKK